MKFEEIEANQIRGLSSTEFRNSSPIYMRTHLKLSKVNQSHFEKSPNRRTIMGNVWLHHLTFSIKVDIYALTFRVSFP